VVPGREFHVKREWGYFADFCKPRLAELGIGGPATVGINASDSSDDVQEAVPTQIRRAKLFQGRILVFEDIPRTVTK